MTFLTFGWWLPIWTVRFSIPNTKSMNRFSCFKKLKDHGIIFVAASGRQYFNLAKTLDAVKDEVIFAAENGSYVVFRDEEIHVQAMDQDIARELISISRNIADTYPIICGKKKAYVENDEPEFINHLKLYFERYEIVEDLLEIRDDQFLKFTLCDLAGSEVNSYPHYKKYEADLQVKVSGPIWLDISHKKATKAAQWRFCRKIQCYPRPDNGVRRLFE
jgi:hydroxymethylpyrimidine pyrophosphatase-like HAD family hydrolase